MTVSSAQAAAFYSEVNQEHTVWSTRDAGGVPAPVNPEGLRAMPFWSKRSRAEQIVASVPAYQGFEVFQISLQDWRDKWLPDLADHGIRIGLNWSGARATGYDVAAEDVLGRLGP